MEGKQDNRVMLGMFKPIERIPEWAKCCPSAIQAMEVYCGKIFKLDMASVSKAKETTCTGCGRKAGSHPIVLVVEPTSEFAAMLLEFVDLEGD